MKKKIALSLLFSALFLTWAISGIHFSELKKAFQNVSWTPFVGVPLLMLSSFLFRSIRWHILLKPIQKIPIKELFFLNSVGFLAIFFFPLRLGEFVRPLLLKQRYRIPFSTGMTTIAVERVLDGLTAIFILILGLLGLHHFSEEIPFIGVTGKWMVISALSILLPLFSFMLFAVLQRDRAFRLIRFVIGKFPPAFAEKALSVVDHLFKGLHSLPNVKSLLALFACSFGVWGSMVVVYELGILAFRLNLPWSAPFAVTGISAVGVSVPAAPGFVGTFQVFVEAALALYGIAKVTGLAYSIVLHSMNMIFILIMGLISLTWLSTNISALYAQSVKAE